MKKYISGLITGFIIAFSMVAFAAEFNIIENPYPVLINGVVQTVEGYNINGFTFLKLGDFKKAGLTVKFNETDKQIEVTSPVTTSTAAPLQTLNNTEVTNMTTTTKPASTPDGITKIVETNGIYYISFLQVRLKLKERGYTLESDNSAQSWLIKKGPSTIINNLPFTNVFGMDSFEYDYYVNTILPATQQ